MTIAVSPFQVEDITDAEYTVTLRNGLGEVVWSRSGIRSTQFGSGDGSLNYVATCDPNSPDNQVELVLDKLFIDNGVVLDASEYVNPCTADAPCIQEFACTPGGTGGIDFNLTISVDSNKGFYKIGVRFQDVHCSAEVACRDSLLHVDGVRSRTHVVGFACSSGYGTPSHMYYGDLVIRCTGQPEVRLSPSLAEGNQAPVGAVSAWAIYRDNATLPGYRSGHWNIAFSLSADASDCVVSTSISASEDPFGGQACVSDAECGDVPQACLIAPGSTAGRCRFLSPANWRYPVATLEHALPSASDTCGPTIRLDGASPELQIGYTPFTESTCFPHQAQVTPSTGLVVTQFPCP